MNETRVPIDFLIRYIFGIVESATDVARDVEAIFSDVKQTETDEFSFYFDFYACC